MRLVHGFVVVVLLCVYGCATTVPPDTVSIAALQARTFTARLELEKRLRETDDHVASLMSFEADGLKQFTLLLEPRQPPPVTGYPVVIFGHGFHPDPPRNGVSSVTGKDWRPGDYYRGIPERYAQAGYLVVAPDYRGHNVSEGLEYTRTSVLATSYYASDVLHLTAALDGLPSVDSSRVFYVGHSMGGEVGLKVLMATDRIRAASLWAPVAATTPEQVLYYAQREDTASDGADSIKLNDYLAEISEIYAALPVATTFQAVDPVEHLEALRQPVIIHHSRRDDSVPYMWSQGLVSRLHALGREFVFHPYDSAEHLFSGADRERAFERDLAFFETH